MNSIHLAPIGRPFRRLRVAAGFTLTEILIAIALIVMIVAVAVANLSGVLTNGKIDVCHTFVTSAIDLPLQSYQLSVGHYPSTEQGLNALITKPDGPDGANWRGPYLTSTTLPLDPWNNPYQYAFPGTHNPTKYDVWSYGPDGIPNTPDDIGNW